MELIGELLNESVGLDADGDKRQIVLGAVNHPRSGDYMATLANSVVERSMSNGDVRLGLHDTAQTLHIVGSTFEVHVVQLQPYSVQAGIGFAAVVNARDN